MNKVLLVDFGSAIEAVSVRDYLRALFTDHHMIGLEKNPNIRFLLGWFFSRMLARRSGNRYERIKHFIDPARERSELAAQLQKRVDMPVVWATRYAKPSIEDVIRREAGRDCERLIVIPLFPHDSYAVTSSIVDECERVRRSFIHEGCTFMYVRSWWDSDAFIGAWVDTIKREADARPDAPVIMSAHAVPVRHIELHDCRYRSEIESMKDRLGNAIGGNRETYLAYQSRGRFGAWTEPHLEKVVNNLIKREVASCVLAPISFVFDNVETLVDLDLELIPAYRDRIDIARAKPPGICTAECIGLKINELLLSVQA